MSQAETFSRVLREGEELETAGKWLAAAERYASALQQAPLQADIWYRVGKCLHRGGDAEAALRYLEKAEMLAPKSAEITQEHGDALQQLRRLDEAVQAYKRVLDVDPDNVSALTNLGVALQEGGHPQEALGTLAQAFDRAPDDPVVLVNFGTALLKTGSINDAHEKFAAAVELDPGYAVAWSNLAVVLQDMHEYEESLSAHRRALELSEDHPEIHWNYGVTLLLLGDYASGFEQWEFRRASRSLRPREFAGDEWTGEDLSGKTILIHAEQGVGDTLQFARFVKPVAEYSGRVVVSVHSAMRSLMETVPGVAQVITSADQAPAYDFHVPLLSLPLRLGISLENLPAEVPYISSPDAKSSPLREKGGRFRAGLVWAGNPRHVNDRYRSCHFEFLKPLFDLPGVEWVSLQVGGRAADLAAFGTPIMDLSGKLSDFADTAATIMDLDLVISVDTAVAHLAGAMGQPVWIMLPYAPDWRWLVDRADSPWYPSARLFRQQAVRDWTGVVADIRNELAGFTR